MPTRGRNRPVPATDVADDPRLQRLDRLSYLLDNAFRVPGTDYRVGYDALIGLIPGFGDAAGLALSAYIVIEASRFGLPKSTLARMVSNVGLEAVIGAIPFLGDLFDATWKANARNLNLLHAHLGMDRGRRPSTDRRYFLTVIVAVTVIVILLALLVFLIVRSLIGLIAG